VHLVKLVRRAKQAGELREDFYASDMMVLSAAVQATIAFGGSEYPQVSQRALGFILDGLRPSGATELSAPPLTVQDLARMRQQ
jgi:hypothetical protein